MDTAPDILRPIILGLTASPIFGGNSLKAFQTIEGNLNCVIRSVRRHRSELPAFVHRPLFRHVMYTPFDNINSPFSTNLANLSAVIDTLDIQNDPYVRGLRHQLSKATRGTAEYSRIDQMLSKVILKESSFTHKGLRDFARSATEICLDLGSWAADWYVWQVLDHAKRAANPYNVVFSSWKNQEKAYLLSILNQIVVTPVSYYADDVVDEQSDKVRALIDCLLSEKKNTETENESYSGLIFVQRRDTVLALAEVLRHHPLTKESFRVGCLLGTSDSSQRHSFLDITRTLVKEPQDDTLLHFKIGEKNLIVSTAVAEEGIDIQACGSVIRWDPPANMVSWVQSRGRARRQRSTYTVMFATGGAEQGNVAKWENLEREMVALYNDPSRELDEKVDDPENEEEEDLEFRIPSTGALLTLHSAVAHLSHFCAVIPSATHVDNRPLYDIDPPEMPQGWHSFDNRSNQSIVPYPGPFGSKVTLPRSLPLPNREFATPRQYQSKISAHRHAAFMAYRALYDAELLNDNLLPITSVIEPPLEAEVKIILQDVEKRAGTANVSVQMDPWAPEESGAGSWWIYELIIDGLPAMNLFTRSRHISLSDDNGPLLYLPGRDPVQTFLRPFSVATHSDNRIAKAKEYTRRLFWSLNGTRMVWDQLDFSYLLLPSDSRSMDQEKWNMRRKWRAQLTKSLYVSHPEELFANAELFGKEFTYPTDVAIVRSGAPFSKTYQFIRWRFEELTLQEEDDLKAYYERFGEIYITYPLLVVRPLPSRTNFLIPARPKTELIPGIKTLLLLPEYSTITLLSSAETECAFLLPSVLRWFAMTRTTHSLSETLFTGSPLHTIPLQILTVSMTAPVSQEKHNYQRLETLGDTVLKFVAGIQLLAEYPLWHEGYLTKKKDHAVSNVRLAKEGISKGVYRWIIRDRMLGKKWKPSYLNSLEETEAIKIDTPKMNDDNAKKKSKKRQELSTKVLADVVESLIGAAYLHGGFDLGYECAKLFDLGLKWAPMTSRIGTLLSRVQDCDNIPPQLEYVEHMLGYRFKRKLLLIEALTHASYEQDLHTASYERMEFLGDSVLDMVVIDFLYRAPGKKYSPGHMYLRKAAMVNAHMLAYICLRCCINISAAMPGPDVDGEISVQPQTHLVYLWQCLLHSSPRVLDDQTKTVARYRLRSAEIEEALNNWTIFPWAELTRLQAPKFFSDIVEALLGVVYLDSEGDMGVVREVMRNLGIMQILERIVEKDIDVLHPVSRLSLWASRHAKELQYHYEKTKGEVTCIILVDGWEEARCTDINHGRASQEEVRLLAAEKAIQALRLRDVGMNYMSMKRKKASKEEHEVSMHGG